MMYCACKYAPAELLAGFGEKAERLDPSPAVFTCAESCTHPNMCSYAKAIIEEVYEKGIRALVLTDCCDAMRRVFDALQGDGRMEFLWLLPLPHKDSRAEIRMFRDSLEKLIKACEDYTGKKFDAGKALAAYREQQVLRHAESGGNGAKGHVIRIAGAHGGRKLLELAGEVFPDIPVVDDTCSGNRRLEKEISEKEDFLDQYAEALLCQKNPCMRMQHADTMDSHVSMKPAGTIFHTIKFCDYYGFQYMMMAKGGPEKTVKIETDTTQSASGQLRTRLEAFREELGEEIIPTQDPVTSKNTVIRSGAGSVKDRKAGRQQQVQWVSGRKDSENEMNRDNSGAKLYAAGIDSGSTSTDAVIMDRNKNILARVILPTAAGAESSSEEALRRALEQAGLRKEELFSIVSTGYGRGNITVSDQAVTEITCHAKGAHFLNPDARTVIDIGGQDSKVIRIDADGKVQNFVMNDKCAAGTGRFLEMQARTLGLTMEEMSAAGQRWKKDLTITAMCTVFAESEVVSLVAGNTPAEDIIHGLNKAVAKRTAVLAARLGGEPPYIMTGGVAKNEGVVHCLEEELHQKVSVSADSQVCGAIGACLTALEKSSA